MKEENYQPQIVYPVKLSYKSEGKIKTLLEKQKLRKLTASRPALQEMLKGVFKRQGK